jgi:hypothetical protein
MLFNPASASPQAIMAIVVALTLALSGARVRIFRHLTSWPMLAGVFVVATLAVPKVIVGFIAPCGALQDTVAAGELLAGRSAYPQDLHPVVKRILINNPLPATVSWLRGVQSSHLACMDVLQVNAHPPLVAVALQPVVAALGYFRPILLFQAITLVSLILMVWLWSKAFGITLQFRLWLLLVLVLVGSQPVLECFRGAGLSALLSMLVLAVWYLLRRERDGWAGIVLAAASGLKLFPIVACGSLLFGRMKALFTVAVSLIGIFLGIVLLQGIQIFSDYEATARLVVRNYAWLRDNYSLFANIRYILNGNETLLKPGLVLVYGSICVVAGLALFRLRNHRIICCDFGMAITATMMCLFPPVVWTHYFIILFLPLCILSHYSRWWNSKGSSIAFFLIVASVNMHAVTLEKLSALAGTEIVSSLPTAGVLAIFVWLNVEAFKVPLTAAAESQSTMAVAVGQ